jgi:hypothetical protein
LADELPEFKDKPLKMNIRTLLNLAKFNVMVDSQPSGHLAEHVIASNQRNILARLHPEDGGSSWMIEEDKIYDSSHMTAFEYSNSPTEALPDAVEWAEETYDRISEASKDFPWR